MSGEAFGRQRRRCASALADFRLVAFEEDAALTRAETIPQLDRLVQRVFDEILAAQTAVLEALAGTNRRKPAARLLAGRLDRLRRAGDQVGAAVRAGDITLLRRTMTRFDALARAACAVQLDVYTSAGALVTGHRAVTEVPAGTHFAILRRTR
jgi:hypothetical protein